MSYIRYIYELAFKRGKEPAFRRSYSEIPGTDIMSRIWDDVAKLYADGYAPLLKERKYNIMPGIDKYIAARVSSIVKYFHCTEMTRAESWVSSELIIQGRRKGENYAKHAIQTRVRKDKAKLPCGTKLPIGIFYIKSRQQIRAQVSVDGKVKARTYSIKQHGLWGAIVEATQWRDENTRHMRDTSYFTVRELERLTKLLPKGVDIRYKNTGRGVRVFLVDSEGRVLSKSEMKTDVYASTMRMALDAWNRVAAAA